MKQGNDDSSRGTKCLDGLPMEYWVVPPRTPIVTLPSLPASLPSLHRSGMSMGSPTTSRHGTIPEASRQSLGTNR